MGFFLTVDFFFPSGADVSAVTEVRTRPTLVERLCVCVHSLMSCGPGMEQINLLSMPLFDVSSSLALFQRAAAEATPFLPPSLHCRCFSDLNVVEAAKCLHSCVPIGNLC